MAKPDPLALRRQAALQRLQHSRMRLLVAAHLDADGETPPRHPRSSDWLIALQPLVSQALGALPWLSGALSQLRQGLGNATPGPPEPGAPDQIGLQVCAGMREAWRRHPLIGMGLAAAGATLVWHERAALKRVLSNGVLPDLLAGLTIQAAPWLASCLQELLGPQPGESEPGPPKPSTAPPTSPPQATPGSSAHHGASGAQGVVGTSEGDGDGDGAHADLPLAHRAA